MRNKTLLALTLTTCLTAPAAAESWYGLYADGEVIAYADADSIYRNGGNASVGIFLSHEVGDYHKWTIEFDCVNLQYRILGAADYGSDRQYLSTPQFDSNWLAIDGAKSSSERGFACDGMNRDAYVSDPFADADEYWYYYYYDDE
ncbi:MAG TPA: hypothetical protein VLA37_10720 [Sphingomonadaceae bacterium]|nr:hypothetical protein [Sphingomonadaceae bacterium]